MSVLGSWDQPCHAAILRHIPDVTMGQCVSLFIRRQLHAVLRAVLPQSAAPCRDLPLPPPSPAVTPSAGPVTITGQPRRSTRSVSCSWPCRDFRHLSGAGRPGLSPGIPRHSPPLTGRQPLSLRRHRGHREAPAVPVGVAGPWCRHRCVTCHLISSAGASSGATPLLGQSGGLGRLPVSVHWVMGVGGCQPAARSS